MDIAEHYLAAGFLCFATMITFQEILNEMWKALQDPETINKFFDLD